MLASISGICLSFLHTFPDSPVYALLGKGYVFLDASRRWKRYFHTHIYL